MAFTVVYELWEKASENTILSSKPLDQLTNEELNNLCKPGD
jgi:hypothetical protein